MTMPPSTSLTDDERERIHDGIRAHQERHPRPRRRRRGLVIALSFVLLGAATASGVAWVVLAPQSVRDRQAWCYEKANPDSRHIATELASSDKPDRHGSDALSNCTDVWANGLFGKSTIVPGAPANHSVPRLVLCARDDGVFAVFPAGSGTEPSVDQDKFCAKLGLEPGPAR